MPPAPGPSWRGSAETPARGGVRSWRRPGSGPATAWPLRSRLLRAVLSLLSALVAFAAIALFIFLVFVPGCSQTRFAVLAPAPYSDSGLPPHPFAQQDGEHFRTHFAAENLSELLGQSQPVAGAKAAPNGGGATKSGAASRSVLLLYVTALAGRTDNGVVLYSIDSGPDEPEGYLPLDQLWEFLGKLPREQKKILAIDLARGPVDWRWGQFVRPELGAVADRPDVTGGLNGALSTIPNLAIVTSAAPGEVSWSSPSLSRSVFAHFLIRAIAGEADGSGSRTRDRRVTLAEVHDFVLTHTNHWVSQNRDLRGQHPQLLMVSETREQLLGTVVAEVRGKVSPPPLDAVKPVEGAQLRQLEDLWEARDKWSVREPEQWHPLGWRQFLEHLRRAEQWWLAGQKEGMEPHLQAAEKAVAELEARDAHRTPELRGFPFVATGVSRRTNSGQIEETSPLQPERQLKFAFDGFAPVSLPKPPQDASLRLRAKAEQQSWQSFQSRLWTGTLLADADRDRRQAEDLLFVGGQQELDQSAMLRQSAETKLEQREQIVRELSEAHRLHHRLLAELPDLAWWAAQRLPVENLRSTALLSRRADLMEKYARGIDEARFRPPSLSDQGKLRDESDDSSLQQSEIDLLLLFEQARQLARLIDRELEVDQPFAASSEWREELKLLKQTLTDPERGLDALRSRLTRHAKGLVGATGAATGATASGGAELGQTQYFHWLSLRNALQWSGLPAETRRSLFADLEQSDRNLHAHAQKIPVAAATAAEWSGDDWGGVDGCWQGLWALQSLSLGAADAAMHKRWVLWMNAVVSPKEQMGLLVQLGQTVRHEYRDRADRAQPTPASGDRPEAVLRTLLVAERAARTLHGYDAVRFPSDRDPLRRLNGFDLGALCVAQADRYLEDFWGKVQPNDREAWYVQAVDQCLRVVGRQYDELSITSLKTAREDVVRRLQARQTARLKLVPVDAKVDLSLAEQRPVRVAAEINDQVPPGVAALWLVEDADPTAMNLDFLPTGRRAIMSAALSAELTVRKQRTPPAAKCGDIVVRPRLLFRARYWDEQEDLIRVNPCLPNSIDEKYESPATTGEIVVHGTDRRDTLIILDCSLSMAPPMDPKKPQGDSRFQAARRALSEALRVLRDGPALRNEKEPHVIGLMAYGHRAKAKGNDPNQTATNPDWKLPIPMVVSGDWRNDFELLLPPSRLLDKHYQGMVAYLDPAQPFEQTPLLQPFGQTPLLGAILSSAHSLIERNRGGVIVAITDGAYNDGSPDGQRYKSVQELLSGHPELSLHIVAFGVDEKSEIASLKKLGEHTRGTFHDAPNGAKLAEAIERVMKPRQYAVIREAQPRAETFANLGQPISERPPHTYKVRFPGLAEFPATIVGGERLEFDLDAANNGLKHRRLQPLLFQRVQDATPPAPHEPTRFGYLKADYDKSQGRVEFLFCLDRDDPLGMIERPAEIRIDIVPRGSRRQFSRSWMLAPGQSLPVWQVELRNWPPESKPEVRAWWKMTRTEPDAQLPLAAIIKEPQPAALPGWPDRTLTITAERQPGKVLVRLQAGESENEVNVADVRVELGQQSQLESRFLPAPFNWRSQLFEAQRQVTFTFDVGENFDATPARIALTSRSSLDRGSRALESPLVIEKWDKEQ